MISTVTTAVITIASIAVVPGLLTTLGLGGALTLISCLVMKQFATDQGPRMAFFSRNLDIVILPLLFVFSFIAFMKVWEILF